MLSALALLVVAQAPGNLVQNPGFEGGNGNAAAGYAVDGAARREYDGYSDEIANYGVSLDSAAGEEGSVSQLVKVDRSQGKWITFRFRGRAEDGFAVKGNALFMQIDFYTKGGQTYIDTVRRLIYREIEMDRKNLTVNGDGGKGGANVWRSYDLEELLPFPEVDAVKLTVGFKDGAGTDKRYSRFLVDDFSLTQSDRSLTGKVDPAERPQAGLAGRDSLDTTGMVALGGRWYYQPVPGEQIEGRRLTVTYKNADRLFYKDDRLENPFANSMTAWLRKGFKDLDGHIVQQDRLVTDNVVVIFDGSGTFQVIAHNIPNHPTARFPDTYGTQGYNPSYIQEQIHRYRLPLDPRRNLNAVAMTANDSNYALPMGAVGLAVNGVVFYNPFDAGMQDASNIMDRCCGHPSPDNRYHYHKYPICVNTPFVDKGESHSPLIGFAFDGFPIYGPYEGKDVMAKDLTANQLDAFNAHYDPVRGWHYHVTPGKFPYVLGGYIGNVERSDLDGPFRH